MTRRFLTAAFALLALLIPAGASGVWGGTLDTTHPQVGAMYFDGNRSGTWTVGELVCSGSYAGTAKNGQNAVFLTAGHCIPPAELGIPAAALRVSFGNNDGLSLSSEIVNPVAVASYHQMPGFGHDLGDLHDLGILLLNGAPAASPVQLAPAGFLDTLKDQGTLNFRIVDLVGYGKQPSWEDPGPTTFVEDGMRRSGTSVVTGLGKGFLKLKQSNGIGTGSGLCFGDSGSPQIDQATQRVVSVATGGNGQCKAISINYRVDTPQAREFLGGFLNLP